MSDQYDDGLDRGGQALLWAELSDGRLDQVSFDELFARYYDTGVILKRG